MFEINNIPNLEGKWIYQITILRRSYVGFPNFNNLITTSPTICNMTQKDNFVILEIPPDDTRPAKGELIGTITSVRNLNNEILFYKLTFSDYDDNGVYTLTNDGENWSGTYTEAGFTGGSQQYQTAGIVTLKKV